MTEDTASLSIIVDASSADKATRSLDSLSQSSAKAEAATSSLAGAGSGVSSALKETAGAADTLTAAHGRLSGSAVAVRESLVLVREASNGNFTRMAGSASILAGSFGLLTPAILGSVGAVAALAAPLAVLGVAFEQGQKQISDLNNALAVTNEFSGLTADGVDDMAKRIAASTGTGIGQIRSTITALVASGQFTGDVIEQVVTYSTKLAELTGQDAGKVAASFETMTDGVAKFAEKHADTYHDITQAQLDYIAALEKAGDKHAAELEFFKDADGKIKDLSTNYGTLQQFMQGVATAASDMWDAILAVGRQTPLDKLNSDLSILNQMRQGGNTVSTPYGLAAAPDATAAQIEAQTAVVRGDTAQVRQGTAAAAAGKGKNTPTLPTTKPVDDTAQQTAAVAAAVAQSQQAYLQAQLALTTDLQAREVIEQKITKAAADQQQQQTARQIADVEKSKGLSDPTKARLVAQLESVQQTERDTANLKSIADTNQSINDIAQQALGIADAQREAETTILGLQQALTTNVDDRYAISTQLLQLAGQTAEADAKQVIAANALGKATDEQAAKAQITLANLPTEQALRQQALDQQHLIDLTNEQATLAQSQLQNQIDVLTAQKSAMSYAADQDAVDKKLADLQEDQLFSKNAQALTDAEISGNQDAIAKATGDYAALVAAEPAKHAAATGTLFSNYDKLSTDLSNVSTAVSSHDWGTAMNDLINSFKTLKAALADAGANADSMGKAIGSIGGAISGIGGLIGGQAGSTISGAGSGAVAGAELGSIIPGVGTVVGAVAGGLGGLLSGLAGLFSNAADAAAKLAAAQTNLTTAQATAQTAIQAATTAANNQNQAEEALLTASGQAQAELNLERQIELASVDATTQAIDKQLYAWQDYNTALATATTTLTDAQSNLNTVYAAAVSTLQSTASTFQTFITNLEAFKTTLSTGDLAQNSPSLQYALTKSAFQSTASAASTGDQTALGNIEDAGSAFLTASAATAKSLVAYETDLASVKSATDTAELAAQNQISLAQQQLETMNAMVGGIIAVANIVSSVSSSTGSTANSTAAIDAAMANLITAVQQVNTAQTAVNAVVATQPATPVAPAAPVSATPGYTSTNGDFALYVQENPDLLKEWLTDWAPNHKGWTEAEYGAYQWNTFGINEGRAIRPYAKGGAFTNGIVSNPTAFDIGVMGEAGPEAVMPLARGADGSLGVRANDNSSSAEITALRAEVANLTGVVRQMSGHTKKTADLLYRCTQDGSSLITTAG